ncbi:hypothetical protein EJ08DRAFT_646687 [Tothia fuscella]|uniref:Uncharacterized protein n=1 Tax=Tothia fuscella TaxID=1048955 RepID=A0A9P4U2Q5_9PEZI|nr:hypothetical protein EJ08DRAFT_646687 [Tothia fuscella]
MLFASLQWVPIGVLRGSTATSFQNTTRNSLTFTPIYDRCQRGLLCSKALAFQPRLAPSNQIEQEEIDLLHCRRYSQPSLFEKRILKLIKDIALSIRLGIDEH